MAYQEYAVSRMDPDAPIDILLGPKKPLHREMHIINESKYIITVCDSKDGPHEIQGHTAQRFYWDRDDCLWHKKD